MEEALKALREKSREIVEAAKKDIQKAGTIPDRPKIKEIVDGWAASLHQNTLIEQTKKGDGMTIGYMEELKVLHRRYVELTRLGETIESASVLADLKYLIVGLPYKERLTLPQEINDLMTGPDYRSVADMEPKGDPIWEALKEQRGVVNPPDSLEDIGVDFEKEE